MSPIQQMLLGAGGAVATKTYVDDIFSTQKEELVKLFIPMQAQPRKAQMLRH